VDFDVVSFEVDRYISMIDHLGLKSRALDARSVIGTIFVHQFKYDGADLSIRECFLAPYNRDEPLDMVLLRNHIS
jgi:hypothetical protein